MARAQSSIPAEVVSRRGRLALAGRYTTRNIYDDLTLSSQVLGTGRSGQVVLAEHREFGTRFAVKTLSKLGAPEPWLVRVRYEAEVFLTLDHPHLARLEQVYESPESVHLVMEYLQGADLLDTMGAQNGCQLSEERVAEIAQQVLLAVAYLHAERVAHRDLNHRNFIYERPGQFLKLIDYGCAARQVGGNNFSKPLGTQEYTAPEVYGEWYTEKADMWSVGIILFALLCGKMPWPGTPKQRKEAMEAGEPHYDPSVFGELSKEAQDFVQQLLSQDQARRLSATAALQHAWLQRTLGVVRRPLSGTDRRALERFARAGPLKRAGLVMAAWSASPELSRGPRKSFLEAVSTGRVTLGELGRIHCAESSEKLFEGLLPDATGRLSFANFLAAMLDPSELGEVELRSAFRRFDDGGGAITVGDLASVLGEPFEGVEAAALLAEADDASGHALSFNAFAAHLRRVEVLDVLRRVERVSKEIGVCESVGNLMGRLERLLWRFLSEVKAMRNRVQGPDLAIPLPTIAESHVSEPEPQSPKLSDSQNQGWLASMDGDILQTLQDLAKMSREQRWLSATSDLRVAVESVLADMQALHEAGSLATEFTVKVSKRSGKSLGVDVDLTDGTTLRIDSLREGVIQDWNDEHGSDVQVKPGYRIVEVNGLRGDNKLLVDALTRYDVLEMVIAVGQETGDACVGWQPDARAQLEEIKTGPPSPDWVPVPTGEEGSTAELPAAACLKAEAWEAPEDCVPHVPRHIEHRRCPGQALARATPKVKLKPPPMLDPSSLDDDAVGFEVPRRSGSPRPLGGKRAVCSVHDRL